MKHDVQKMAALAFAHDSGICPEIDQTSHMYGYLAGIKYGANFALEQLSAMQANAELKAIGAK
jgi:hypothetical protein